MADNIAPKRALPISDVLKLMIVRGGARATHNAQRIYLAWNEASGAGEDTIRRYYRDGRLVITLNSSVVRSALSFQKDTLIKKINAIIAQDSLYIGDGEEAVKELVLK
ncbi:MAG: DUF721 domain-containing protein [Bacteroidales bacterium]|nr:DUF721 domain-containing protein [Bacteroidales bacterium]